MFEQLKSLQKQAAWYSSFFTLHSSFKNFHQFLRTYQLLLTCRHVLQVNLPFSQFAFAHNRDKRNPLRVRITHLLLHLRRIRINLRTDTRHTHLLQHLQAEVCLRLTKVHKQQLSRVHSLLRIEVKLVQHVEDAVGTKRDAHTAQSWHTEDARQVVVAATTRDGANLHVQCLHLEDGTRIIVQAASQRQVQFNLVVQARQFREDILRLLHTLQAHFALPEHLLHRRQFLPIRAAQVDDWLQLLNRLRRDAILRQFSVHRLQANLVQFVNRHCDVHNLVRLTNHSRNTRQNLTVVDFDAHTHAKPREHGVHNFHQLHLVQQRVASHHIGITLVELPVSALLRTVSPPHRLNLETLERQCQLLPVLHHISGKRHRQVIPQALLAKPSRQLHLFSSVPKNEDYFHSRSVNVKAW